MQSAVKAGQGCVSVAEPRLDVAAQDPCLAASIDVACLLEQPSGLLRGGHRCGQFAERYLGACRVFQRPRFLKNITGLWLLQACRQSWASAGEELHYDELLTAATDALVDELRAFSPLAQRTAKKLLNDTEDAMLSTAIELEGHCYSRLRQSDDFREGVEAFHAKRPAKFKGT